jgi:two-component system, OmpR family, copper resistance phosphate regulon response regulator CusR
MIKVLVIEDEPRVSSFMAQALAAEGFEVRVESDGGIGVATARDFGPDVVLLDLMLPGLDGMAVIQRLCAAPDSPFVIVVSARTEVSLKVAALELGAVDFMVKPFSIDELLARIRVSVRGDRRISPPELCCRSLTLNLLTRTARYEDSAVVLTDSEARLLSVLIRADGELVSRERLLSEVWGYSFDPKTNVVEVGVGRLRKKFKGEIVETVRRRGYRLVVT